MFNETIIAEEEKILKQMAIGLDSLEHLQLVRIWMAVWGSDGNKTCANTK